MYNSHQHRGMVPPGPPQPDARLNELLDQVRAEFNAQAGRTGEYENQITGHLHEMESVRHKIFELERRHLEMKSRYEEENAHLRRELETRGGAPGPHQHHPPPPQPPSIGQGQGTLFGQIMSGGHAAGAGVPGLAPPPPPGLPQDQRPGMGPAPSGAPQGPPGHFGPYPSANGYPAPQQPAGSPGGKNAGPPRRPPGPATPQQSQLALQPGIPDVGNHLADLDPETIPPTHKREGPDWFAVFNPRLPRRLDVDLVHNLGHNSVVCCVRFSADGMFIATGCNRSAQIFDVETGQQVAHLQDPSLPADGDLYIRSVCFSPDGRHLATGAEDKIIRVWDIQNKIIRHHFQGHEQDIYSLDFARNGRMIASGSGDRSVRLWDLEQNSQILALTIEDGVTTVAISPDNRFVAAGSLDKSVRVWDIQTGFLVERLEGDRGHRDSVYSVAFSPNGRDLVSGSLDKTIKLWELSPSQARLPGQQGPAGGKCVRTFEGHKDFVLSVALTPDAQWVLSGSKDRGVQFWDPNTGEAQVMLQGHKNSVISVAPSPRGGLFATGSGDQRARIWRYGPAHGY